MNIWQQRYEEQTALCAAVLTERDALGELLERADEALGDSGLGSQGSPLRVEIHEALKNYRKASAPTATHPVRCTDEGWNWLQSQALGKGHTSVGKWADSKGRKAPKRKGNE